MFDAFSKLIALAIFTAIVYGWYDTDLTLALTGGLVLLGFAEILVAIATLLAGAIFWVWKQYIDMEDENDRL